MIKQQRVARFSLGSLFVSETNETREQDYFFVATFALRDEPKRQSRYADEAKRRKVFSSLCSKCRFKQVDADTLAGRTNTASDRRRMLTVKNSRHPLSITERLSSERHRRPAPASSSPVSRAGSRRGEGTGSRCAGRTTPPLGRCRADRSGQMPGQRNKRL